MGYMIKKLNKEQIRYVYETFMTKNFPDAERKPLSMIYRSYDKGIYECYGCFDSDKSAEIPIAYAFVMKILDGGNLYLLDYYAVAAPEMRDKGIGSTFLKELFGTLDDPELLICEAEYPESADDTVKQRRVDFYLRNGFSDPGVRSRLFGVEYKVLVACEKRPRTADEIRQAYTVIYRTFLPFPLFRTQLRL
ncbi:MAG: GNAT family N-acetyltransferase [Ruminiclostridium sp.]|nr:GNAT family N-acetyltransferase [Ruminiclostridium sp.]